MLNILKKYRYKVWKHLTKSYVKSPVAWSYLQTAITISKAQYEVVDSERVGRLPLHIVACQGYYNSGSSALIGLLQEFADVTTIGEPELIYATPDAREKEQVKASLRTESRWFKASRFFELVQALCHEKSEEEIDHMIKKFISCFTHVSTSFETCGWDFCPAIYGKKAFRKMNLDFLDAILDLDTHTREKMRNLVFPVKYREGEGSEEYEDCSFIERQGHLRYPFYRVRKTVKNNLTTTVSKYLESFFSLVGGQYVVHDQIFPVNYLEIANQYMKNPIRQICVTRDPRDTFISFMETEGTFNVLHDAEKYCKWYEQSRNSIKEEYEYRLVIRFEDLVLNYEKTVKKIASFLGLDLSLHNAPQTIFVPGKSVQNLGVWRLYHNQSFMKDVERRLSNYCCYPERENLPEESRVLLHNSGNWDGIF